MSNHSSEPGAMRLQKFLSLAGVASRRHAEELIAQGRVKISGKVVTEMGVLVIPGKSRVEVDNKPVFYSEERNYILFHKPAGCITSLDDPENRTTVIDLLPKSLPRVFPVGRLDWDTEGLLLLTNDGELAYKLTHPGSKVPRVYHAKVRGELTDTSPEFKKLQKGVELEDGFAKPDRVSIIKFTGNNTWLEIELHIGRNRIIRRMCDAIGCPVMKLRRVMFGDLTLDGLPLGAFRDLTQEEVADLYSNVDSAMDVTVRSKFGVRFAKGFDPKERTMPRQSAPSREKLDQPEERRVDKRPRPSRMKFSIDEKSQKNHRKPLPEQPRFEHDENRSFNNTWDHDSHKFGHRDEYKSFPRNERDERKSFPRNERDERKSFPRNERDERKSFPRNERDERKSFPRNERDERKSFPRNERDERRSDHRETKREKTFSSAEKKRPFAKGVKPKTNPRSRKSR